MEKLLFEYPYFIFKEEDPEDSILIQKQASIHPVNLAHEPYDVFLDDNEHCFHLIFGKQSNGRFLCIPNYFIGCELSSYDDVQWNEASLSEAADYNGRIDYNDISAICYAIKALHPHLI